MIQPLRQTRKLEAERARLFAPYGIVGYTVRNWSSMRIGE
jgi:hypothetical protein